MKTRDRKNYSNPLYPVFLKMDRLQTLIVGGGSSAGEKLHFLLKSSPDATVTLVAPEISQKVKALAANFPGVLFLQRRYDPGDLYRKHIVIVATGDRVLNRRISREARAKNILINVTDTPVLCDFYLGSIVTRGDLKIAVSTNGKSPVLAKRFRQALEDALPGELSVVLDNLGIIREKLKNRITDRVKILHEITSKLVSEYDR